MPRRRGARSVRQPQATFVELSPALLSAAAAPGGPLVEVMGPSGGRLTVQLPSGDLEEPKQDAERQTGTNEAENDSTPMVVRTTACRLDKRYALRAR